MRRQCNHLAPPSLTSEGCQCYQCYQWSRKLETHYCQYPDKLCTNFGICIIKKRRKMFYKSYSPTAQEPSLESFFLQQCWSPNPPPGSFSSLATTFLCPGASPGSWCPPCCRWSSLGRDRSSRLKRGAIPFRWLAGSVPRMWSFRRLVTGNLRVEIVESFSSAYKWWLGSRGSQRVKKC